MKNFSNFFPLYKHVRLLLKVWENKKVWELDRFRQSIKSLPNVRTLGSSWDERQTQICKLLPNVDQALANEIWIESKGSVNPTESVIEGCWIVCKAHGLFVIGKDEMIELTEAGANFKDEDRGKSEIEIDYREGLFELLRLINSRQPCQKEEHILPAWGHFLTTRSSIKKRSTIEGKLSWRIRNLVDRDLIQERPREQYELTKLGRSYLRRLRDFDFRPIVASDVKTIFKKYPSNVVALIDPHRVGDLLHRLLVESAAVEQVRLHFKQLGYECVSVETENRGWDLECSSGDDRLLVEVKGVSDPTPHAQLTSNEFSMSKKYKTEYRIAIVSNTLENPELHIVRFDRRDQTYRDEQDREYRVSPKQVTVASVSRQ